MNARTDALTTLRDWHAPAGRQSDLREAYLAHLERHPDALDRSCAAGHLTAGTLVLSPALDAVLLNLHAKARRWFHFGGHHEPADGSLLGTATREALEESGIAGLDVHPVPVHLDRHTVALCRPHGTVDHLDVRYAALAPAGAEAAVSDESLDVRWWSLDALPDIEPGLEPEMHELIARARERLAQSSSSEGSEWSGGSAAPSRRAPAE